MKLRLCIPLTPLAQPRVKACIRGEHAGVYTPSKNSKGQSNGVAEYKSLIQLFARLAHWDCQPCEGPIRCDVTFVFPRPPRLVWKKRPMPRHPHTSKPDRDNLDKAALDALKGIVWKDDAQVCCGSIEKWYAAGGELPHVLIVIEEIE